MGLDFNGKLWVFQDIDMISFPIKKQFIKFLRAYHPEINNLTKKYEKSNITYLEWFMKNELINNKEKPWNSLEKYSGNLQKIQKIANEDINTYINDLHKNLLRQFGDTNHFISGRVEEIYELNKKLKEKGIIIIGITSRGTIYDEDFIYTNCREKTENWNLLQDMKYDKIFLQDFSDKHRVIHELQKDPEFSVDRVICMMEDNTKGLINMVSSGIQGVLYDIDNWRNQPHIDLMNEKYPEKIQIVHSYADMKDKVLELTEAKLNEYK